MKHKIYQLTCLLLLLAGFHASAVWAQGRTVSGKVTTADTKESLPGVTVLLKGTSNGTGTGADGSYSLEVPATGGTLVFSFVGYTTQEVALTGQSTVNVVLVTDQKALEEVVVVGYGTQKASNVTGAIASVTAKEIEERPVNRIENALVGQMPGVYVQTPSGEPGAELQIRVRGGASINASNEPLYVVDGVPVDNLRGINPTDVANIEVLKDAASAAIYGSRGSNGVVLVTTKRGRKGPAKLNFSGFAGLQNVESKLQVQSAEEWIQMRKEGIDEDWLRQNPANRIEDTRATRLQRLTVNGVAPSAANVIRYTHDPKWQYGQDSLAYTDWQDALFRRARMQQYTIGASGGTDNVTYNINGSYLDQEGIIIGTNLKRATLRANFDAQISKGIKLFMTLAPSMEWASLGRVDGTGGQALNAAQMPPVGPKDAGVYVGAQPFRTYNYSGNYISPVAVLERSEVNGTRTRLNANMGLNVDLYKGLQMQLLGAMDNGYYQDQQFFPTNTDRNWFNAANDGALSRSRYYQTFNTRYLFQSVLNYTRRFGDHNLSAILGYSVERTQEDRSQQENTQLPNDWTYLFDRGNSTTNQNNIAVPVKDMLLSYFTRAQYDYKEKYLLSASLRRDGSSKFGSNRPFGYFPAVSVGWRVSGENFMQGVTAISDLKFRASWGVTGNNRIPSNSQFATLGVNNYPLGNGTPTTGYSPGNFQNDVLGWEQTASYNYGLDFGMLGNRLQVTADYYIKNTTDLLYTVPVSSITGFTRSLQNIGNVRNVGVELGLNSRNLVGAFQWNTSFNASYNDNKVLKLGTDDTPVPGGFMGLTSLLQVGVPINSFYLYEAIGVYKTQAELDANPRMTNSRVGDTQYRDVNGDGIINNDDRTILGNPQPKFIFGVTNNFVYKNFDLNVLVNAQQGGDLYSVIGRSIDRPGMGYLYNHSTNWNNRWRSEANPGDGMTPAIGATTGAYFDSRWLYSSDYVRVKNITLGYTLPKKRFYSGARVYLALENAYIWHNYTGGFSPEALQPGGFDNGSYPQARTYTLGFNLSI
ncbi:SusC/RagA family TonB-linked outer membrane protein [Hymenobacter arizonensis]|uniref:TonB-linked outer membrane protein, SusC/RagA family n=1 Tax=Hymenobacter arizonensis TaxID=1227077 RepID=A0A1I6AHL1_HYMAR|nr:TonB-dependent receptor [Hymenobacter arizonensis]SFQ68244.1 TonB-linked outer membrane protein, SusC/RagA family [Hymenobacter arizonensis]